MHNELVNCPWPSETTDPDHVLAIFTLWWRLRPCRRRSPACRAARRSIRRSCSTRSSDLPSRAPPGFGKGKYDRQSQQRYSQSARFGYCCGRAHQKVGSEETVLVKFWHGRSRPGQAICVSEKSARSERQPANRRDGLNLKQKWIGRCPIVKTAD